MVCIGFRGSPRTSRSRHECECECKWGERRREQQLLFWRFLLPLRPYHRITCAGQALGSEHLVPSDTETCLLPFPFAGTWKGDDRTVRCAGHPVIAASSHFPLGKDR